MSESKNPKTLSQRINYINNLLKNNNLRTMVNFNKTDTEYFIKKKPIDSDSSSYDTKNSYDTSYILEKRIHDFYKIISRIGGKLIYIKSGTSGHTFKGVFKNNENNINSYAVKVVAYPKKQKYGDINDIRRPENAELLMIKVLSYFVINKQTPHVILPIGTFNTSIKPFLSLIEDDVVDNDNKKYKQFIEKYKKGNYHEQVSILMSEWANKGDLLDFIRRHYTKLTLIHWKVFLFQIISTLAVIQSKFPSFRHNDLKANNILVHKDKNNKKNVVFRYTVNNRKYVIPNIGYQIKLWDFDFACIPGIVDNKKVNAKWTNEINVIPKKNRYYDVHYFFNTLIKKGFFPQFNKSKSIPPEVREFVYRIVPEKYRNPKKGVIADRGRILLDIEYTTPNKILKHDTFFEEFRKTKNKK
jgi:hypothetical protein